LYLYFAGVVCAKLGKGDQALMYLKKAISMKPDYAPAHFNIAYTYQEIKRNNLLAKYHYIIFLKLEPGFPGKAKILRFIRSN
jgi:tetratricopeptide (TPR) repeat protein